MKKIAKIFVVVALASFSASLAHSQEVYTSNVVILLDASGSMDRTMRDARGKNVRRIDAAKSGIYEVLKQVPDTTNVGILALIAKDSTDYDKSRIWVYPLGKKDDAKLRKALELVEPYGNTPLGTFAKIGADRLIQERVKQHNSGSFKLLIATDGEANEEPSDRVDKYILDIISKGIRVDVIGVAMKSKHTLATNAHSYRRADDPASLTKAIKEVVLAEISPKVNPELAKELNDDVAGFPDEVAMAIISTLSEVDNMLIGEKPKPKPAPAKTEIVQQSAPASQQSTSSAEPASSQTQDEKVPCFMIGLICFVVVMIVAAIASASSSRW